MKIKVLRRRKTKNYIIEKHKVTLTNGQSFIGYKVMFKHPDQRHLIARNFMSYKDAINFAKEWRQFLNR